jgi:hypothetical protein
MRRHSGLEVKEIVVKSEPCFERKLHLDLLCPKDRLVFFDSDYYLLRRLRVSGPSSSFIAVHDPSVWNPHAFPHTDCERFGLDKRRYFNTGFFVCDLRVELHRRVFQLARQMYAECTEMKREKPVDWTDQFFLNAAVQQLGVPVTFLPFAFNFYKKAVDWGSFPYIPREIVGLHGAGIPVGQKFQALRAQATVFGEECSEMSEEAIRFHHAFNFELR